MKPENLFTRFSLGVGAGALADRAMLPAQINDEVVLLVVVVVVVVIGGGRLPVQRFGEGGWR